MWSECRSDETDVLSNMKGQRGEWKDYSGRQTVLPEYPFLIVVPPTLVEQVTVECTRFLQAGSLDVVKITGGFEQHKEVWETLDKMGNTDACMRLYVASTTVSTVLICLRCGITWGRRLMVKHMGIGTWQALQSDSAYIHNLHGWGKPTTMPWMRAHERQTIFGRRYLGVAVDEAHGFRNVNKLYGAVRALREKTDIFIAMTATPVQTRPSVRAYDLCMCVCYEKLTSGVWTQNLWLIGKVIGLPGFSDANDRELDDMNKALARAKREDRKEMKATSEDDLEIELRGLVVGDADPESIEKRSQSTGAMWMTKIREKYEGAVIRRTVKSKDYIGQGISGLKPYEQHRCVIRLHEHEYEALEGIAEKAMNSEGFALQFASEVRQAFFVWF